ncbi:hypothetical protein [Limnovirga soli]|uniref:Uncharacterized protein n=1 Tax=Limnovirga soli TaxID=2656915 RepID=A0A8J8FAQ7_9BACT|nr:hypothetical protein [Limnovirga soli]NNV54538.1 hypothetical protein [Limnovirga soli]
MMQTIKKNPETLIEIDQLFPKTIAYFKNKGCTSISLSNTIVSVIDANHNVEPLSYDIQDMYVLEFGLTNK